MPSVSVLFFVISTTLVFAGCTAAPSPAATAVRVAVPPSVPQIVPLKRGEMPAGWRYNGLAGPIIQFANPEADAAVNFHVFSSQNWTAESVIRRLADQGASRPGVTVSGIFVMGGGSEAGLNIRDSRIGTKRGRAVARTFPGRSSLGVMVIGLWPAEKHAGMSKDFDKFLDWVRLD
jgi:hypothetical protein